MEMERQQLNGRCANGSTGHVYVSADGAPERISSAAPDGSVFDGSYFARLTHFFDRLAVRRVSVLSLGGRVTEIRASRVLRSGPL